MLALFISFSTFIGLASISLPSIGGSSEAREAHVIQLMNRSGDYVLPLRNGIVPSKPPLFHWIGLAAVKVVGSASPFAARIPSLLAGAVMLLVTIYCALQFALPSDQQQRKRLLVLSASILTTMYLFEKMRTVAMVDAVFSAAVTVSVAAIVIRLIARQSLRSIDFTLFYFSAGMAVLAKGPIGIVLPHLIVLFPLAMSEGVRPAICQLLRPKIGWIVFVLIAIPWYVLAALRQSHEFLGRQILFENISRFIGGEHITIRPWYFYVSSVVRECLPWTPALVIAQWNLWRGEKFTERRLVISLYCAVLFVIVFLSFSGGKRESYLLPLFPWITVALTPHLLHILEGWSEKSKEFAISGARSLWYTVLAIFFLFFTSLELSGKVGWYFENPFWRFVQESLAKDLFVSSVVFAFAVLIVPLANRFSGCPATRAAAWSLSVLAIFSISLALGFSIRNRFKNFDGVASQIRSRINDAPLIVVRNVRDEFFDGILYYLDREVTLMPPAEFPSKCRGFVLVRHGLWSEYEKVTGVRHVETYFEIDDRLRGNKENQKELLYCVGGA